ncbi:S16 family serine protease [Lentzea sp. NPDC004789]
MSALSTLDDLLAQAGRGELQAPTPDQLRARLSTGLLWWEAVSAAVIEAPDRLGDWERGTDLRVAGEVADREFHDATRVLAAVGLALAAVNGEHVRSEGVEAITAAARRWHDRGLLIDGTGGAHRWRRNDSLDLVDALPEGAGRSLAHIAVALMSGVVKPRSYQYAVGVLFDTGERKGATGSLKLAVVPGGPPGLFPDPRTMTFLRVDPDFTASLKAAWDYATQRRKNPPCVLWTIDPGERRLGPINGPSLGAAFAVALTSVLTRVSAGFLKGWRGECAVTGAVTAQGEVGGVRGLEGKFEAARKAGWQVVAPEANRENAPNTAGLEVHWVGSVVQARARTRSWRPWRLAGLVLMIALITTIGLVVRQRSTFAEQQDESLRQRAVSELLREAGTVRYAQREQALRLVLAANGLEDSTRVRAALVATLTEPREPETLFSDFGVVRTTAFSQDGHMLIAGTGGAAMWQVVNPATAVEVGALPAEGQNQEVPAAAMNTAGTVAVLGRAPMEVWDVNDKKAPKLIAKPANDCGGGVVSLSLSQSGHRLLSGCRDGTVTLWDLSSPASPRRMQDLLPKPADLNDVGLSANADHAEVATSKGVFRWEKEDLGEGMRPLRQSQDPELESTALVVAVGQSQSVTGYAVGGARLQLTSRPYKDAHNLSFTDQKAVTAVATGGTAVLTGIETGEVILWDESSSGAHRPKLLLYGHTDVVTSVGLSSDGTTAVTGSRDGSAKLWDLRRAGSFDADGTSTLDASVDQVVTSPASSLGVVITDRGEASVWDLNDSTHPRRRAGVKSHRAPVRSAAMDPGRAQLATGSDDGVVQLSDISTADDPRKLSAFQASTAAVRALAFHPGGARVAAGGDDGAVVLADVGAPTPVPLPRKEKDAVRAVAFDEKGELLAVGDAAGRVELWKVGDGLPRPVSELPKRRGGVRSVAFDPRGGSLLVALDTGSSVLQWDVTAPEHPVERPSLQFRAGKMRAVTYSRDGTMVIGADTDSTAVVWSVLDPGTPYRMAELTGHTGPVVGAAAIVGGDTVLTGSVDKTVIAWDIADLVTINHNPRDRACQEAQGTLREEEWQRHDQLRHFAYKNVCVP